MLFFKILLCDSLYCAQPKLCLYGKIKPTRLTNLDGQKTIFIQTIPLAASSVILPTWLLPILFVWPVTFSSRDLLMLLNIPKGASCTTSPFSSLQWPICKNNKDITQIILSAQHDHTQTQTCSFCLTAKITYITASACSQFSMFFFFIQAHTISVLCFSLLLQLNGHHKPVIKFTVSLPDGD